MKAFKVAAGIAGLLGLALGLSQVQAQEWTPPILDETAARADGASTLSVMTYNIEGLPFPLRMGRNAAAHRIADRLKEMRAAGQQPHVVVLQEAFGDAQRSIGREAGYKYVAFGPSRDLANTEPMSAEDKQFAAGAELMKGERAGKWMGSGLAILSDYPIVSVARAAFPAYACAGFDCLANKGVMMATVAVPGVAQPIAVIATHLNSKNASGVAKGRWTYAFARQVQTMGSFLKANLAPDIPYVVAGDLNIGRSPLRSATFASMLAALPRAAAGGLVRTALATCLGGTDEGCTVGSPVELRKSFVHNKDWQAYADGGATRVGVLAVDAPFGHDAKGRMLSDHIGYTAFYRLAAAAPAGATVTALR